MISVIQLGIIRRSTSALPIGHDPESNCISLFNNYCNDKIDGLGFGGGSSEETCKFSRTICLSAKFELPLRLLASVVHKLYFLKKVFNDAYEEANGL